MAGLIYFLPGKSRLDARKEKLVDMELGYAFELQPIAAEVQSGPSLQRGVCVADKREAENNIGYFADRQTWMQIPKNPAGAWVGCTNGARPTPADLARENMLDGHRVRLADDQLWQVPVARKALPKEEGGLNWTCGLPSGIGIDADGQWAFDTVAARYQPLWEKALAWFDDSFASLEDGKMATTFSDLFDIALLALQANYRVGRAEVALLGLFSSLHAKAIANALIDLPTIEAWLKKKDQLTAG